jgi:transcriptional regulator with XRE-family HTH domain
VTVSSSPLVERRRLRAELKQARLDAGLTQESVADQMDWSLSKLIRIETGAVGISTNDLAALLRLYNVKDSKRVRALIAQGREARKQTWWSKYRSALPPTYFQYIEYETAASIIRTYETLIIPGLLQTEEYATAVSRLYRVNPTAAQIKTRVDVRMQRQKLLFGRSVPPLLFFIIDEAVINRLLGSKEIGQAQLEKLIRLADRPEVTIEVILSSVGLHRGMGENFHILEFSGTADNDVLYFESARDSIFSHDATDEITVYRELFEELRKISLGPKDTRDFLVEAADKIRSSQALLYYLYHGSLQGGTMPNPCPMDVVWRVSSKSNGTACVEVASSETAVLVRDTRNRGRGILSLPFRTWMDFVENIQESGICLK